MNLSDLNQPVGGKSNASDLDRFSFIDYYSYEELTIYPEIMKNLIFLYQRIFSESEAWEENYKETEIEEFIKNGLSGDACLRICFDVNETLQPIGFCWAQKLPVDAVLSSIESIQFYRNIGSPNINEPLKEIMGNSEVVYIHDLGISLEYRGRIPLESLVIPPVRNVVMESEVNRVLFWSNPQTCIHHLAHKVQIPMILESSEMQFFLLDVREENMKMAERIK